MCAGWNAQNETLLPCARTFSVCVICCYRWLCVFVCVCVSVCVCCVRLIWKHAQSAEETSFKKKTPRVNVRPCTFDESCHRPHSVFFFLLLQTLVDRSFARRGSLSAFDGRICIDNFMQLMSQSAHWEGDSCCCCRMHNAQPIITWYDTVLICFHACREGEGKKTCMVRQNQRRACSSPSSFSFLIH